MFVHHTRAPLGLRHPDHHKCAVVLGPVKDKPWRVGAHAPILDHSCARQPALLMGRGEETVSVELGNWR